MRDELTLVNEALDVQGALHEVALRAAGYAVSLQITDVVVDTVDAIRFGGIGANSVAVEAVLGALEGLERVERQAKGLSTSTCASASLAVLGADAGLPPAPASTVAVSYTHLTLPTKA